MTQGADATATDTYGGRYIFGGLDQHFLDTTIRLNWLLSPNMSIQLYAQPFLATGDYEGFKALSAAELVRLPDLRRERVHHHVR